MSDVSNETLFNGMVLLFAYQLLTLAVVAYHASFMLAAVFCGVFSVALVSVALARIGAGYNRTFWKTVYPDFVPEDTA